MAETKSAGAGAAAALADMKLDAPERTMVQVIGDFSRRIRVLATELKQQYPKDEGVTRAHSRIMLALDQAPEFVIQKTGHELEKYLTQITERNAKFFEQSSYEKELGAALRKPEAAGRAKDTQNMIPLVKAAWAKKSEAERAQYWERVEDLLTDYADYKTLRLDQEARAAAGAAGSDDDGDD